jgi:asparagine synthase (glutamine-hydrolysing)
MTALFGFTGPADQEQLVRMKNSLHHRAGENPLFYSNEKISIGCSEPMTAKTGHLSGTVKVKKTFLALAGYITDPLGKITTLEQLLSQIEQNGFEIFSRLNGDFICAVHDGSTLTLVRDMSGIRSVYFGMHRGRLIFSVEPKGICSYSGFPRRLRPASLVQYLSFSFVAGRETMFHDIEAVPPGHILKFKDGCTPGIEPYCNLFTRSFEEVSDMETWSRRFVTAFRDSIRERLPESGPVGIFLSGGLDSSIVTAEITRMHRGPVKTWSIHFGKEYTNELEFASAVAGMCGTDHREVLIDPKQFLPRIREMIWHLDEPIGDPITTPNFELARIVSREIDSIFNGEGGDPCFGGPKNLYMLLKHWYGGLDNGPRFRERIYCSSFKRAYEDMDDILTPEFRRSISLESDLYDTLTPFFNTHRPEGFLDKLMVMNIRLKGANLILPKVERMLSAWGINSLSPLFDWRIVQLSLAMPSHFKVHRGQEKVLFKHAYRDLLPREVLVRPKSGMRVPVHFWFQGDMKKYVRKILNKKELKKTGIFNHEYIKQLIEYSTGNRYGRYGLKLWMLITFEIWRRIFIEGETI